MFERIKVGVIAFVALILISAFVLRTDGNSTFAQDAEPTPTSEPDAEAEQRLRSYSQTLASQDISAYNIMYLISENTASNPLIAADQLADLLGAKIVSSWAEFLSLNAEQPAAGVLIHASAIDWVDPDWTRDAYRNRRIPIVGINLYFDEMATLTGNSCLARGAVNPFEDDYFVGQFYAAWAENAVDVSILTTAYLDTCATESPNGGEIIGLSTGTARVSKSGSQQPLTSSDDVAVLRDILVHYLFNASLPTLAFQ